MKARLTALKCWKVAKPQVAPMSVNEPYLRNWVLELYEQELIIGIWWGTNRTNQWKCIFKTKFIGNIFNNYVSSLLPKIFLLILTLSFFLILFSLQSITTQMYNYYLIEAAFYISLMMSVFTDVRRKVSNMVYDWSIVW